MAPPSLRQNGRRPYLRSGIYTLKRAVQALGSRALPPGNTTLGRELRAWRNSLVADLGGPDAISTQRASLIEMATTTRLLVSSVDAYLLSLPSLVDKRHRRLWPVVRERQALVGQLQAILRDLGLERRAKDATDIAAALAALHEKPSGNAPSPPTEVLHPPDTEQ
jgi:hypothetical protein